MSDCRFGVSPVNYPDPDPANCATGSVEYVCMYAYMCACLNVRVCMWATDGQDRQRMERWVDLHVYMCVRAYVHVCATLPTCV